MIKTAHLSPSTLYRYHLSRRWADGSALTFVMLNPSTADANEDDPTIRRIMGFARSFGYSGVHVVNLYALRVTDSNLLFRLSGDIVGDQNNNWLGAALAHNDEIVCAWGIKAKPSTVKKFKELAAICHCKLLCLGQNKNGSPKHPLYLSATTQRQPFT